MLPKDSQRFGTELINLITPRCYKHETSPYNTHTSFSKQIMRIFELIR